MALAITTIEVNMKPFSQKIFAAAPYTTTFFGPGRPDFNPKKQMPTFETYLEDSSKGTFGQVGEVVVDEGIISNFMAPRFINQANLPGFLPHMVPSLEGKMCIGTEGACGSGGRAIAIACRSILSSMADVVFVTGFEIQNTMKALYGADVLAGAAYYAGQRKEGHAFFFPGIFSDRAGAYYERYGYETARKGMARWYEQSILNSRKNPKAQEYYNATSDLLSLGMQKPNPQKFVPHLNLYDCSKVSDGACSILLLSEEGLARCGIEKKDAVEIVGLSGTEANIMRPPTDLCELSTTKLAAKNALAQAKISLEDLALQEIHDCFSITALLALEAIGHAKPGESAQFIEEGHTSSEGKIPTNLSGGLGGFGHPTGASGVRQLVDLTKQLTGKADHQIEHQKEHGLMISMGGDDKTVTAVVVKRGA